MSTTITASDLSRLVQQLGGVDLIDVRTPVEFREVHVDFAKNVPLDQLDPKQVMASRAGDSSAPLYVICKSGARGEQARKRFSEAGFNNVVNVEGGTQAAVAAGLPVNRGQKAMSLERQVRIAAGSIVLTGVLLAWFVNPAFVWLSGFVGAGLVFAGVTDTCGMGMLLARMPWNQVSNSCKA
ncbi:rhodanese-like domain-containing protein [Planctomicrobium sp. SH668]|uniref:rhodanese-like domain-containing protein n=1 Tax=Planctomicrobium sp. SH668 TaxID=3448126 RepID=UPI003F5BBFC2